MEVLEFLHLVVGGETLEAFGLSMSGRKKWGTDRG